MAELNPKQVFRKEICKTCGYCGNDLTEPSFCMVVYSGNKDRFLSIIQYLLHMRKHEKKKYKELYNSFDGFCGLYCNSKPPCPQKSKQCEDMAMVTSCFIHFVKQNGADVDSDVKSSIYESFSGVEMNKIGRKFRMSNNVSKNARKSIRTLRKRLADAAGGAFVTLKGAVVGAIRGKQPSTSFFFRDSPKWIKEMEDILGEKLIENDKTGDENRQSVDAA